MKILFTLLCCSKLDRKRPCDRTVRVWRPTRLTEDQCSLTVRLFESRSHQSASSRPPLNEARTWRGRVWPGKSL